MQLSSPPYLQIALDLIYERDVDRIVSEIPSSANILLEAGTPLIKSLGISVVKKLKKYHPKAYIVADMKTLDVGEIEVFIAETQKANAVAISGLASIDTIESSLRAGKSMNIDIILDLMNVKEPIQLLEKLSRIPEIILFHRGIDQEGNMEHPWEIIAEVKRKYIETLVAVAGGLNLKTSSKALSNGADIIVIGRAITQSKEISRSVKDFLNLLN
ncbi:MAG: orotidine 5'-phosphate decarboxylase / HUMPS family protein [Candidatus Heimdallarchaeaceae archaeon]